MGGETARSTSADALAQFEAIEPELYRFPAIDPDSFIYTLRYRCTAVAEVADRPSCIATT